MWDETTMERKGREVTQETREREGEKRERKRG